MNRTKTKASKAPVPMCEALATTLTEFRQQTEYSKDEDFIFASAALRGKQPLCGQTMNAQFVKPAAIELRLADELSVLAGTVFVTALARGRTRRRRTSPLARRCLSCQTGYHGDLHARELWEGVGRSARVHGATAADEARFGVNPMIPSGWHRAENSASRTTTQFQMVESSEDKDGGRYRI